MESRSATSDAMTETVAPPAPSGSGAGGVVPGDTARRARALLRLRAAGQGVVSVYLTMPLDPAERRGLPSRVRALQAEVEEEARRVRPATDPTPALDAVGEVLLGGERRFLGRGRAVIAALDQEVFEDLQLPQQVPDLALLGDHPYVRPLLAAVERSPMVHVAVADRRYAWLFQADACGIIPVTWLEGDQGRSRSFGGWYGLEEYRVRRSAEQRLQRHHRETAAALDAALRAGESELLVVGGHAEATAGFAAELPADAQRRMAGTFVIDPRTMTPSRVHELTETVVRAWRHDRQRKALDRVRGEAATRGISGLSECVQAANRRDIELLCLPEEGGEAGYVCDSCKTLSDVGATCALCDVPGRAVADLWDELALTTLTNGGEVRIIEPEVSGTADDHFPVALRRHG
jgi:hypothetical protein